MRQGTLGPFSAATGPRPQPGLRSRSRGGPGGQKNCGTLPDAHHLGRPLLPVAPKRHPPLPEFPTPRRPPAAPPAPPPPQGAPTTPVRSDEITGWWGGGELAGRQASTRSKTRHASTSPVRPRDSVAPPPTGAHPPAPRPRAAPSHPAPAGRPVTPPTPPPSQAAPKTPVVAMRSLVGGGGGGRRAAGRPARTPGAPAGNGERAAPAPRRWPAAGRDWNEETRAKKPMERAPLGCAPPPPLRMCCAGPGGPDGMPCSRPRRAEPPEWGENLSGHERAFSSLDHGAPMVQTKLLTKDYWPSQKKL